MDVSYKVSRIRHFIVTESVCQCKDKEQKRIPLGTVGM